MAKVILFAIISKYNFRLLLVVFPQRCEVTANQCTYNYKERNEDFGLNLLDYGARWYDASLGRWWSVDPLAEKTPRWSPYHYGFDNPLKFIDPTGMESKFYENGEMHLEGADAQNYFRGLQQQSDKAEKLKTAASNAVAIVTLEDGTQEAKCSKGVALAFTELTGSTELSGMRANQQVDYMKNSNNFMQIDVSEVQGLANQGEIVIAGWQTADYLSNQALPAEQQVSDKNIHSGHVALAVPGEASMSGTWRGKSTKNIGGIPNVMDTGLNKRTESQPVNQSFGKDKQGSVLFFRYVGGATPEPAINQTNPIQLPAVQISSERIRQTTLRFQATDSHN